MGSPPTNRLDVQYRGTSARLRAQCSQLLLSRWNARTNETLTSAELAAVGSPPTNRLVVQNTAASSRLRAQCSQLLLSRRNARTNQTVLPLNWRPWALPPLIGWLSSTRRPPLAYVRNEPNRKLTSCLGARLVHTSSEHSVTYATSAELAAVGSPPATSLSLYRGTLRRSEF